MNRIDIVGLTLAEVALTLLYAIVGLWLPARTGGDETQALRERGVALQGEIRKLERTVGDQEEKLAEKQRTIDQFSAPRPGCRSRAAPSCAETGFSPRLLFTTVIRGSDSYEVAGRIVSVREILTAFEPEIAAAKQAECVHRIGVAVSRDLGGVDYDAALRRMEQYFYLRKLGVRD